LQYLDGNSASRFHGSALGTGKLKYLQQSFVTAILDVLNKFIWERVTAKSTVEFCVCLTAIPVQGEASPGSETDEQSPLLRNNVNPTINNTSVETFVTAVSEDSGEIASNSNYVT